MDITNIMEFVKKINEVYWQKSYFSVIFIVSLLYFIIKIRNNKIIKDLGYYTVIMFISIYNPISVYVVTKFLFTSALFVRLYTIIPIAVIISIVMEDIIYCCNSKKLKFVVGIILTSLIIVFGKSYYVDKDNFAKATNIYKLPDEIIEIGNLIDNGEDTIYISIPESIGKKLRQYNANIVIVGRIPASSKDKDKETVIEDIQTSSKRGCRYIITNYDEILHLWILESGYYDIARTESYIVYERLNVNGETNTQ